MTDFEPKPFGKYYLTDRIAVGGMAEIYKAKTFGVDGFEKTLAIKKILSHYSSDKEFITMLTDEAKLVVNLSHANIVQVYDLARVGDEYFISMEFIDGINLRDLMVRAKERGENIPAEVIISIAIEVCKGLDYAHNKKDAKGNALGIVHRDISPQNILVSYEGGVKIVDFGIAKAAQNLSETHIGILKGKVTYMSPEQAFGKPIDGRTDLFSLGIILYELFALERLFTGESQMEILKKIRNTKISPKDLPATVPVVMRPILAKLLAYKVKDRYQSAADLQVDLNRALYGHYPEFSPKVLSQLLHHWFLTHSKPVKKSENHSGHTVLVSSETHQALDQDAQDPLDWAETVSPEDDIKPGDLILSSHPDVPKSYDEDDDEEPSITEVTEHSEVTLKKQIDDPHKTNLTGRVFVLLVVLFFVAGSLFTYFYLKKNSQTKHEDELQIVDEQKSEVQFEDTSVAIVKNLLIDTNPSGAQIKLNGQLLGHTTPYKIDNVMTFSILDLEFNLDGYEPLIKRIRTDELFDVDHLVFDFVKSHEEENQTSPNPIQITQLKIESKPSGAMIFLDGMQTPLVTPYVFEKISWPSQFSVELKLDGYQTQSKAFVFENGEAQEWGVELLPILASFEVTSDPVGAKVFEAGKLLGVTPLLIQKPIGVYTLLIKQSGHQSKTVTVDLSESQSKPIFVKLNEVEMKLPIEKPVQKSKTTNSPVPTPTPQLGTDIKQTVTKSGVHLRVDSSPRGARVMVNGVKRGITPIVMSDFAAGQSVSISVSKDGYKTWQSTVKLKSGQTEVNARLLSQ